MIVGSHYFSRWLDSARLHIISLKWWVPSTPTINEPLESQDTVMNLVFLSKNCQIQIPNTNSHK